MATKGAPSTPTEIARTELEGQVQSLASRYGFRSKDFDLIWDGGALDPSREEHEVVIAAADGRRSQFRITHEVLLSRDRWKSLRGIEAAFKKLQRREASRGE